MKQEAAGSGAVSKILRLLTPGQIQSWFVLLGLMLIGMALETVGIGLVVPAVALMTHGDPAKVNSALGAVLESSGSLDRQQLLILGMLTLVGVYAIKALFLAFLAWRQASFVANLQQELSQRLFGRYLRQPYTFHLQRNSAQLIRNVIGEVGILAAVTGSALLLLSETLVVFGITVLLLVVEPVGASVLVFTLGLAGWAFHRLTQNRILRWGIARQHHEGLRIQHLQQGLGGAKEVKLLGREDDFLAQYQPHNTGSARVSKRQSVVQQLPRLWFEGLAVTGLALLALIMLAQGKPVDNVLPTLGLFAVAAFRLMAAAGRYLGCLQSLRYASPVIDTLNHELSVLDSAPVTRRDRPLLFRRSISVDQVSFTYPSANVLALHAVSLTIEAGTSVGFIGGSGSGKSTLADIILGLLTPESGHVRVDGVDIQGNLRGWQDQIGYVPQSIFLTENTVRRNVAFGVPSDQINDESVWRALRAAQLETFVRELTHGLDTIIGERGVRLSGGQRQRVGIARALYHDPPVLVLDEATGSLDTATERGVIDAVQTLKRKKTILIVAHRFSTVAHCDRLFRLERGCLVEEGDPAKMLGPAARAVTY